MPQYLLGGSRFRSKDSIREHIRKVVAAHPPGCEIRDSPVVADLLRHHPEWPQKSHGMKRLVVGYISYGGAGRTKGILIERESDVVDISWRKTIDLLRPDGTTRQEDPLRKRLDEIKIAARVSALRQTSLVHCPPGYEVDHVYPRTFDRLLFLFLKRWGAPIFSIGILDPPGPVFRPRFACALLESEWLRFHGRLAVLRAVPADVNRSAKCYPVDWGRLPANQDGLPCCPLATHCGAPCNP